MADEAASVGLQIEAALEDFRFNASEMEGLLKGPVMQDLARRAIAVESAAKENASGGGIGPEVRTGRLRGSITWRAGEDGTSPYVDVGSAVEYAPYVEFGTSRMSARPYLAPALEQARA